MKISQRITAGLLCLSIVINIGLVYNIAKSNSDTKYSHSRISNIYDENLSVLSAKCNEIEQSLSKLTVCTECEHAVKILSDIIDDSSFASAALSSLPVSPEYIAVFNRFFNHLSDYSRFMLFDSVKGTLPATAYGENISALYSSVKGINSAMASLYGNSTDSIQDWSMYLSKEINELDMLSDKLFGTIESIQTESINYPTLIYDGPFSDSVINKVINETGGKNTDKKEAERLFVNFLSVEGAYRLAACESCDGNISTWYISIESNGKTYYGNVAKKTGTIISFLCDNNANKQKYTKNDAVNTGSEFLKSHGYNNMEPQYCEITENIATVNYVYKENNILIYPDMVKLRINLENGKVEGFESSLYYANHNNNRSLEHHQYTVPEDKLPNNCNVTGQGLALIPTDGDREQLCIEIRCTVQDEVYILYFDCETLKEVKIFKILSTENGDFAV